MVDDWILRLLPWGGDTFLSQSLPRLSIRWQPPVTGPC